MKPFITILGLALLLGGCASHETAAPAPTAQEVQAKQSAEQMAQMDAQANAAREIAKAQQAQREAAAQQAAAQKAAADKAAADKAAADKLAADKAAAEKAAADKAAAEQTAAQKAAADKAAADKAAADKAAAAKAAAKPPGVVVDKQVDKPAAAPKDKEQPVAQPSPADLNVVAEIETSVGKMVVGFLPDVAPGHVKNFCDLARKGFYDGTLFHRTIPGFMIQGGDPLTKDPSKAAMWGSGGPGYTIKAEFNKTKHLRGTLSMARSQDPNSAGSQFFICHAAAPGLDNQYTVFGELLSGYDVLDKIATAPAKVSSSGEKSSPVDPVKIIKVTLRPRTPDDKKQGG